MTARHYSNSQNLVISLEYSWFLAKNLSNFVSLPWKLHNRKCHSNGRPWFVRWCPQEQLYLKSDAVDVVLQVLVDLDPLFSRRTKFVPKMSGMPKVRQIARIFPSDLNNIDIFTWKCIGWVQRVILPQIWTCAIPSFNLYN